MKTFVFKTIAFVAVIVSLLVCIGFVFPYNKDGYVREQIVKDHYLADSDRNPTIVLCGGSNVAFGYDCLLLKNTLGMDVYNNGVHAGMGLRFILDNTARFLKEGDCLVVCPEYSQFYGDEYYGHQPMTDLIYLNFVGYSRLLCSEQWYAVANYTPMSLNSRIMYYVSSRLGKNEKTAYRMSGFNEYGDLVGHRTMPNKDIPIRPNPFVGFNEKAFNEFVGKLREIEEKNIKVLLYPPPVYDKRYEILRVNADELSEHLKNSGFPFICQPSECTYDDKKFYDTAYHLNGDGAILNSQHLSQLLLQLL